MNSVGVRIIFVYISALFVFAVADGGNMAPCLSDSHCASGRSCRAFLLDQNSLSSLPESVFNEIIIGNVDLFTVGLQFFSTPCQDDHKYCVCIPLNKELLQCSSDSDCSDGEQCFESAAQIVGKNCVAEVQVPLSTSPKECSSDSDCSLVTTCVNILDSGTVGTFGICFARFRQSTNGGNNGSFNNNGSGDGSDVCIAVKSLRHLQPHQLVYQKHMTARVLCDEYGSCATAGHMVRFRGRAMMMKSYCELVGNCERTITMVNSPRYTRALQIPSDSPDLTFTAFAARYASAAEEHVLRSAVRLGL